MKEHPPLKITKQVPIRGFYYHKNHVPSGPVNNAAYEVTVVAVNAKDSYPDTYGEIVTYRPLYPHSELPRDRAFCQSLANFTEKVMVNGVLTPRFRLISEPDVISRLVRIKKEMYG